ncbi:MULTISPECIES: pyridoxal phosphate-dependent aminotransferase [unclassified Robiginitalea]|uniref:pyridoxal phosphate-dependent aminotransferase n=1 Tax=Robiginitalea TaxID=252306 RepID=UPI00234B7456|nr:MULTISPECIES: histidinol-phosphate transaminase [unclassified Robiginitalea]MDC6353952.1 histidinol-phosphate transaminase [Robiginitalea sp. PM2]MDC6374219.1 histidinol-phosphate transaminase [Robiginitalea sp. SP8]
MTTTDRRNWLRTVALGGGFALLGGAPQLVHGASRTENPAISARGPIRLSSNENPLGPSERVRRALSERMDLGCRYPYSYMGPLVSAIAAREEVPESCVVLTGGSTEGLKAAGLVYGLNNGEIIAADPTFQALLRYAELFGAYVHRVPLDDKLVHDLDAMERRVTSKTRLIFLCNPNNPSGTILDGNTLRDFCTSVDSRAVVFSDEAYFDYITEPDYPSMVELVREGRNVIVSRTFSKVYGLAGFRIGYLVARPDIASRLREALMAHTGTPALIAAEAALGDDDFYKESLKQNEMAKKSIYATLEDLGLPAVKSHTNFVFFKSGMDIRTLQSRMESEGVLIGRPFPPLYDWARISTGRMEEVAAFGNALKKVMG